MPAGDATGDLRRAVYLLLGAVAVGLACAKVVGAENVLEPSRYKSPSPGGYGSESFRKWPADRPDPTPMFSSNDKSRWATVRALVDHGTYSIGRRVYHPDGTFRDEGIVAEGQYRSLDVVMNPDTKEFYSSKPPLLSTAVAGGYWLLKRGFGWSIVADRWLVVPAVLLAVNVLPFAVYLFLTARLIDLTGKTDFGRVFAFAVASVGTFLLAFAGTLNNHLPGAFCVLFAGYPLLKAALENRDLSVCEYLLCGFFAGLAATMELPALAFLAAVGIPLWVARPKRTTLLFLPAAAVPIAALFVANKVALGSWLPAYSEFGGPWYEFEGSHWQKLKLPPGDPARRGIDFAAEPKDVYAFHLLLGHHGWFSLTPVWLLALGGLVGLALRSAPDAKRMFGKCPASPWTLPLFAAMTLVVSAVLVGFFVYKTNNYGGNTSGPRWLFWLIPLWTLALAPAADRLGRERAGRALAALLLGVSVVSVAYPAWNPWRPPWLLQWMEWTGRVKY
jgi:hypothetical protein